MNGYRGDNKLEYDSILSYIVTKAPEVMSMGTGIPTIEKIIAATIKVCMENESLLENYPSVFQALTENLHTEKDVMQKAYFKLWSYIRDKGESEEAKSYSTVVFARIFQIEEKNGSRFLHEKTILDYVLTSPSDAIKSALNSAENYRLELKKKKERVQEALKKRQNQETPELNNAPEEKSTTEQTDDEDLSWMAVHELIKEIGTSRYGMVSLTYASKLLYTELKKRVVGQDNAINCFVRGFFEAYSKRILLSKKKQPAVTFLFAGPPGVGKTFLAETGAKILGLPFRRFDMSEFADHESALAFAGSNQVYSSGNPGLVTGFVDENPECVLLFDEVEKSHPVTIRLFLQMLDSGRLRDTFTKKVVSFSRAIIIMTTNTGRQLYEGFEGEDFSHISRKVILDALKNDINPITKQPYFPPEICSRFSAGNVVMFNYLTAAVLKSIIEKEISTRIKGYREFVGLQINVDDNLYPTLLFAEGGNADARTITNRARSFISDEVFELLRIVTSPRINKDLNELRRIDIQVDIPLDRENIRELYVPDHKPVLLIFSDEATFRRLNHMTSLYDFYHATTIEEAKRIFEQNTVTLIIADPSFGINWNRRPEDFCLNIEDVESPARDFLWFALENYPGVPFYMIQCNHMYYSEEERDSFQRLGVRDIIDGNLPLPEVSAAVFDICRDIQRQNSVNILAKTNKVLTFETSQLMPEKDRAVIRLFDFELENAINADDAENILSNASKPDTRFGDVIGAEEAKKELSFFVNYLKSPKKYIGTGLCPPKGVLLYGPPGTGKTMLARAMAGEADVTFIAMEGNSFMRKYVGEGVRMIHELFRKARKYAPTIVFIDEIDTIGMERSDSDHSRIVAENLTALLTEMDGFNTDPSKPVFLLAATNYSIDGNSRLRLDPALVRRFDSRIYVDLPNRDERRRYMELRTQKNHAFRLSSQMLQNIAVRSAGMSLAQLENVMELSLRMAVREGMLSITDELFDDAFETFNSGERHNLDPQELVRTARHEAGHTVMSWLSGEKPTYVTITPRAGYGGYVHTGDSEDKHHYTRKDLLSRIRIALAGRAAEILYYGDEDGLTTGAANDLEAATSIAYQMICSFGMSETFGPISLAGESLVRNELVRKEVSGILERELKTVTQQLEKQHTAMNLLVRELVVKNHLTETQIMVLLKEAGNTCKQLPS